MYCDKCGEKLPEDALFCGNCGARLFPEPEKTSPEPGLPELEKTSPEPGLSELEKTSPEPGLPEPKKKKSPLPWILLGVGGGILVLGVAVFVCISMFGKSSHGNGDIVSAIWGQSPRPDMAQPAETTAPAETIRPTETVPPVETIQPTETIRPTETILPTAADEGDAAYGENDETDDLYEEYGQADEGDEEEYDDEENYEQADYHDDETLPQFSKVKMKKLVLVSASSALSEYNMTHSAARICDKSLKKAWVEGASGQGIGENVTFTWDKAYEFSGMTINAGYQKTRSLYKKNSRPKKIELVFSDGTRTKVKLRDIYGAQRINLDRKVVAQSVKLVIKSVYKGSKYKDTVISEVSFF